MKLAQEDNPQTPDDFLALLCYLWKHDLSINPNPAMGKLAILGTNDEKVIEWVARNYSQAEHWLPGRCDGCTQWVMERTQAYWGSHPMFCHLCLAWTLEYFDRNSKWPDGNWFPGETFELNFKPFDHEDDE